MANSKFLHEEIYRGKELVAKLSKQHLTVCGAGALGSNLVDNLTRQGFSNLKVIDKDRVETHNLNTQIWNEIDIGALKVDALKNKIFRNIGVEVEAVNKELTASNVKGLLKGSSLVVDVFDNTAARKCVQDECRLRNINCIHCGLFAGYGEIIYDDFYRVPKDVEGDVCDYPLARNLIMLAVAVLSEEVVDFCISKTPRKINWSITLKDLTISRLSLAKITNIL